MKKTLCFLLALLTLMLSTLAFTGCGGKISSDKNTVSTQDEISTSTVKTETKAEITTAPETTSVTEATTKPNSDTNKPVNNNSGGNTGNSNSNSNSVNGGPVSNPTRCTITVGNKGYTANVGDTVTYVCNLKTPAKIEDIQATVSYDSSMLELVEKDADVMFPVLGIDTIYNTGIQNKILFNAIRLRGYDFTSTDTVVTLDFKVLKKGGTAVSTSMEVISEMGTATNYVNNYVLADGVIVSEAIK